MVPTSARMAHTIRVIGVIALCMDMGSIWILWQKLNMKVLNECIHIGYWVNGLQSGDG